MSFLGNQLLEMHIEENLPYYTVLYAAFIGMIKEQSKTNIFFAWSVKFIGTFFHEMAHFIASLVFLGKPVGFSIFPSSSIENGKKYYTLGYVTSKNIRWWNVFFISMAPLMLLPLSFWVYGHFFEYFERSLFSYLLYIYVVVSLVFSSMPSSVDFGNLLNGKIILNLYPIYFFVGYTLIINGIIKGA